MNSQLQIQLPTTSQSTRSIKKNCIQIRSFSYKKSLNNPKDLEHKKELAKTFSKLQSPSGSDIMYTAEKVRPETTKNAGYSTQETFYQDGSGQVKRRFFNDEIDTYHTTDTNFLSTKSDFSPHKQRPSTQFFKPAMTIQTHTLSVSQDEKKRNGYMPSIGHKKPLQRPRKKGARPDYLPPPDDYFSLLYDTKRRPFDYTDYEGTIEFYSDDDIRNKIHQMGFRDPNYYSRRAPFPHIEIPEEEKIREKYAFKMPNPIKPMDNEKTLVTHTLGGSRNNIKHVESIVDVARDKMKQQGQLQDELKNELVNLKKTFEEDLEQMANGIRSRFGFFTEALKDDFVHKQNSDFKMQKDIMLLNRDKLQIEKEIQYEVTRLNDLESVLYDRDNMFDVEPADKNLDHISEMNLREEKAGIMKNNKIIH